MTSVRPVLAGLALALLVPFLVPAAPVDAAAAFGRPQARATFGVEVVFDQPVTLDGDVRAAEILVESEGTLGAIVRPVEAGSGSTTLTWRWDVADAHILPNTTLTARWRIVGRDGSVELGPEVSIDYEDTRYAWRTAEGDRARLHWHEGSDAFGRSMLAVAERSIAETSELLGVEAFEPVDFFVYATDEGFRGAVGPNVPETAGGVAFAHIRTMYGHVAVAEAEDPWVNILVPHELVHLVFNAAVDNPYNYPPRWLNEGLAVYLSQGFDASDRSAVEGAVRDGQLIPLDGLDLNFPAAADKFSLAYSESVSALDYLIRTHGRDALVGLIRSYAAGVSDDEAFEAALGVDLAGFESGWRADLGAGEPNVYGPRPAPPGPLPESWSEATPNPGASASPQATGGRPSAPPAASPAVGGGGGGASGSDPGLLLGAAVVAAAGIGTALLLRRRRATREPVP